jgi:hypothetical protein
MPTGVGVAVVLARRRKRCHTTLPQALDTDEMAAIYAAVGAGWSGRERFMSFLPCGVERCLQ